jgi:cytoskeletal protein CcmA (bactofilin family)
MSKIYEALEKAEVIAKSRVQNSRAGDVLISDYTFNCPHCRETVYNRVNRCPWCKKEITKEQMKMAVANFQSGKGSDGEWKPAISQEKGGPMPQEAQPLQHTKAGERDSRLSVINRGMTVKGEIQGEEGLRVQGRVEGSISLTGDVVIEAGAEVQAEISATRIIVEGSVIGNLTASEKVEILAKGRVRGDVRAKALLVHEGASLTGEVQAGTPPEGKKGELGEGRRESIH